jgi:hypothetical protein
VKPENREEFMRYIAMSCCDDERMGEVLTDHLVFNMEMFDDDTLGATAMILGHRVDRSYQQEQRALVRGMIFGGEVLDIRTLASHLDELHTTGINLMDAYLLLSSLRSLELMAPEDDYYPFLKSHAYLSRFPPNYRIPYHQQEELIRLVHDYPEKHEEITRIIRIDGITDIGLVREHLLNAAPVLAEGIL